MRRNATNLTAQSKRLSRRQFVRIAGAGAAAAGMGPTLALPAFAAAPRPELGPYRGPNAIIIRFGGGVRRRETIDPAHTYSPFICHELIKRGTLFPDMEIAQAKGRDTSHGQGTLNILTGTYDRYKDIEGKFFGSRFASKSPTVFEYLRKTYDVPEFRTLIVNGEDRIDEEFYTFSNHHLYGESYRSNVLSLYRFKIHLLRRQLERDTWSDQVRTEKQKELDAMVRLDYRVTEDSSDAPEMQRFWEGWRTYYGESGLVNPRGDRVLTSLTVRAIRELRPKFLMVNYQDCDYVHWGNPTHYTRGIQIIDEGVQHIVNAIEADDEYRGNTIVAIVPDCGRDSNRAAAVPFQHHFNSRSAHEISALFVGPGIARGRRVDHVVDQTQVAATLGHLMGFRTPIAEQSALEEVFA